MHSAAQPRGARSASRHSLLTSCRPAPPRPRAQALNDGSWHLLGLTTHAEGGKGFQLYLDGALAAEARDGQTYIGALRLPLGAEGRQG